MKGVVQIERSIDAPATQHGVEFVRQAALVDGVELQSPDLGLYADPAQLLLDHDGGVDPHG